MTKYTVAVEDKQYKIDLTRTEDQEHFTVKINDKSYKLKLENTLQYDAPMPIKFGEKTFIIQITKKEKQTAFQVKIKDILFNAEVKTQQVNTFSQPAAMPTPTVEAAKTKTANLAIEGAVTAPMAGKIVSIRVKKGETVKAGAVVCILEAMKMENEIVAQRDGCVKDVLVSIGAGVNKGDTMFVIGPSED